MTTLRTHQPDDVPELIALAIRAWAGVEEFVDAALGSPLDRLAPPSWAGHHEAVVRDACQSTGSSVIFAEDDDGQLTGFVAFTVHPETLLALIQESRTEIHTRSTPDSTDGLDRRRAA